MRPVWLALSAASHHTVGSAGPCRSGSITRRAGHQPQPTRQKPGAYAAAFSQHLSALSTCCKAIVAGMRESGYGRILNVLSTSVKATHRQFWACPTAFVRHGQLGQDASGGAGQSRVFTVNNVLPGLTKTARLKA